MLGIAASEIPPCPGTHCSAPAVQQHVNDVCKQNGWPVGAHVLVQGPSGWCYCTCSCLAAGSLVQATSSQQRQIQDFKVADPVYAADLAFNWTEIKVGDTVGTQEIGQPNTVFVSYDGGALTVTADHLFLVGGQKLLTAEKLTTNDTLTGPSGAPVKILAVHQGDFFGQFHNLSTDATTDPSTDPNQHLINTGGVISGDFALQTHYLGGTLAPELLHHEQHARPSVGSYAYHAAFPYAEPTPQAIEAAQAIGIELQSTGETAAGVFIGRQEHDDDDADASQYEIIGFVPLHPVGVLERMPAYPFSDGQRKALGDYLCTMFAAFYPEIDFGLSWYRRNVNVYALSSDSQRPRVMVSGGMLRNKALDVSSISLAMAFAVASIQADPANRADIGATDYNAAGAVMRKVWWDMDYITRMEAAVKELTVLFTYIPLEFGFDKTPIYPSGQCRLDTYFAAMAAMNIPDCATNLG